jgi:hypothetical protein
LLEEIIETMNYILEKMINSINIKNKRSDNYKEFLLSIKRENFENFKSIIRNENIETLNKYYVLYNEIVKKYPKSNKVGIDVFEFDCLNFINNLENKETIKNDIEFFLLHVLNRSVNEKKINKNFKTYGKNDDDDTPLKILLEASEQGYGGPFEIILSFLNIEDIIKNERTMKLWKALTKKYLEDIKIEQVNIINYIKENIKKGDKGIKALESYYISKEQIQLLTEGKIKAKFLSESMIKILMTDIELLPEISIRYMNFTKKVFEDIYEKIELSDKFKSSFFTYIIRKSISQYFYYVDEVSVKKEIKDIKTENLYLYKYKTIRDFEYLNVDTQIYTFNISEKYASYILYFLKQGMKYINLEQNILTQVLKFLLTCNKVKILEDLYINNYILKREYINKLTFKILMKNIKTFPNFSIRYTNFVKQLFIDLYGKTKFSDEFKSSFFNYIIRRTIRQYFYYLIIYPKYIKGEIIEHIRKFQYPYDEFKIKGNNIIKRYSRSIFYFFRIGYEYIQWDEKTSTSLLEIALMHPNENYDDILSLDEEFHPNTGLNVLLKRLKRLKYSKKHPDEFIINIFRSKKNIKQWYNELMKYFKNDEYIMNMIKYYYKNYHLRK